MREQPVGPRLEARTPLTVRLSARPPVGCIELRGELDVLTVHLLADAVASVADTDVEQVNVSLGGLTFIGAAGLAALLAASERLTNRGKHLTVTDASRIVRRVLHLTGTGHTLGLTDQNG